jgi:hypothetical protein
LGADDDEDLLNVDFDAVLKAAASSAGGVDISPAPRSPGPSSQPIAVVADPQAPAAASAGNDPFWNLTAADFSAFEELPTPRANDAASSPPPLTPAGPEKLADACAEGAALLPPSPEQRVAEERRAEVDQRRARSEEARGSISIDDDDDDDEDDEDDDDDDEDEDEDDDDDVSSPTAP